MSAEAGASSAYQMVQMDDALAVVLRQASIASAERQRGGAGASPPATETIDIEAGPARGLGRILAKDVVCGEQIPAFPASIMDGCASSAR